MNLNLRGRSALHVMSLGGAFFVGIMFGLGARQSEAKAMSRFSEQEIAQRQADIAKIYVDHAQLQLIRMELEHRSRYGALGSHGKLTMLIGESGCGKTVTVEAFVAMRNRDPQSRVLCVRLPVPCTIKSVTSETLRQLGDPLCDRNSTASRNSARIIHQLTEQGIRLFIIDEFQHLIDHDRDKVLRQTTDWLKTLLDAAGVPVVCVGLPNSLEVIRSNRQLERRTTKVISLRPFVWDEGEETAVFRAFLHFYESELPFASPSNLSAEPLAKALHSASEGVVGRVSQLISEASLVSMRRPSGEDQLTWQDFAEAYAGLPFADRNPFDPAVMMRQATGERRAISTRGRPRSPPSTPIL